MRTAVSAAGAIGLAAFAACSHAPGPACPPGDPIVERGSGHPSTLHVGDDVVFDVRVQDAAGHRYAHTDLTVTCDCLADMLQLTSDAEGRAFVKGPAGEYRIAAGGRALSVVVKQPSVRAVVVVLRLDELPQVAPRLPEDALPPGVLLSFGRSGCLGPCRRWQLQVRDDHTVWLEGEPAAVQRRRLGAARWARVQARARCLVHGPSYRAAITDSPWFELRLREGGEVAAFSLNTADRRAPPATRKLAQKLARMLGAPR